MATLWNAAVKATQSSQLAYKRKKKNCIHQTCKNKERHTKRQRQQHYLNNVYCYYSTVMLLRNGDIKTERDKEIERLDHVVWRSTQACLIIIAITLLLLFSPYFLTQLTLCPVSRCVNLSIQTFNHIHFSLNYDYNNTKLR